MTRLLREIAGYLLGLLLFLGLIPFLMWLASGKPDINALLNSWPSLAGIIAIASGLVLSIWAILHMRRSGKGNPFDAFGHELAPRTKHLMTDGPYRFSRNPMLLGVIILLGGCVLLLRTWQSALILALFVAIMLCQVASEEKRLLKDFGSPYSDYCTQVHRLLGNQSRGLSFLIILLVYLMALALGILAFRRLGPFVPNPIMRLFCADVISTIIVWLFGLIYRNVSVYDPYWSVAPPIMLTFWAYLTSANTPYLMLLIAVWLWGIRLTANWAYTFHGLQSEDWRYAHYRNEKSPILFHLINFFGLNMMPTVIVFFAMLPALLLPEQAHDANLLSWLSMAVCLCATCIELVADTQRHRFVKQRKHPTEILQTGLWKHGRHPNYFGEISMWWGVWLMYVSVNGFTYRPWLILCPLAMTALFLGISIPLMERRQLANKPAYAEYRKHTRILI